eukprot:2426752-Rhodomonas_salina.1
MHTHTHRVKCAPWPAGGGADAGEAHLPGPISLRPHTRCPVLTYRMVLSPYALPMQCPGKRDGQRAVRQGTPHRIPKEHHGASSEVERGRSGVGDD